MKLNIDDGICWDIIYECFSTREVSVYLDHVLKVGDILCDNRVPETSTLVILSLKPFKTYSFFHRDIIQYSPTHTFCEHMEIYTSELIRVGKE